MEPIVMKTEIQPNGDILLFYVDDNQDDADGLLLDSDQQDDIQLLSEAKYVIEDTGESESADELDLVQASDQFAAEQWVDEEIRRLIVFYLDNKETFRSGTTKKKHLWAVACKTMLLGRQPLSCEYKLRKLREQYFETCVEINKGNNLQWQFYNLCHQAFQDENHVDIYFNDSVVPCTTNDASKEIGTIQSIKIEETQTVNIKPQNVDNVTVEKMLQTYMLWKDVYKNSNKGIWEKIALEMGEKDVEYWQRRFFNYKQYYVRMLSKRENGDDNINWPYMKYFDELFANDIEFQKKLLSKHDSQEQCISDPWNDTEKTFLVKYCFDCLHEFQDPTIPDDFLWHEVGRLLNKGPDKCKNKFGELKNSHFHKLLQGGYDLVSRIPIEIILDCIICKETEIELEGPWEDIEDFDPEYLDVLVQFLYENLNMMKDSICYYVCWALIAKKLDCSIPTCRKQWENLTVLYKSILDDKKENPDMQIDWRYIDSFDRIFDYGMDVNLLTGYERLKKSKDDRPEKFGVKRVTIKDTDDYSRNGTDDEISYDERGFTLRTKRRHGEEKSVKILEYYLKNKDKFNSSHYRKLTLWDGLANKIGITPTECAHRFRNLKQLYIGHVQREMSKPEMPITWPYYTQCKKVFGYRAIKAKLKNKDSNDYEDWTAKEIKKLVTFYGRHCDIIDNNVDDINTWDEIANDLGRTRSSCSDKFLELRKSYRKLKTMKANNPETKVSWKYFNTLDEIFSREPKLEEKTKMEVDEEWNINSEDVVDDDEYQCIIVIPEGEDISQARIIYQNKNDNQRIDLTDIKAANSKIWNKSSKKQLLLNYLNYIKIRRREVIDPAEMWAEISSKMIDRKTSLSCRRMYLKLKNRYKNHSHEAPNIKPYLNIMRRIIDLKPKFKNNINELKVYKDVDLDKQKVEQALKYYLDNIEDFTDPKFEKKFLWGELAKSISEPINKVIRKINYLKQSYTKIDTEFKEILDEIIAKETEFKSNRHMVEDNNQDNISNIWSDLETERLLTWYLAHLDKFKNPKFVRSYLWMEASDILKKSPLVCSKKMSEIRSQYRTRVKESPENLEQWKFYNLCQRIYGTGKKNMENE